MLRRMRGVIGQAILWAVPWAGVGAGLAAFVRLRDGYQQERIEAYLMLIDWPSWAGGGVGYFAAQGALVGAVNGMLFAAALLAAYRMRSTTRQPSRTLFASLGFVATGLVASTALHLPIGLALALAGIGAGSGVAYLMFATRDESTTGDGNRRLSDSAARSLPSRSPLITARK